MNQTSTTEESTSKCGRNARPRRLYLRCNESFLVGSANTSPLRVLECGVRAMQLDTTLGLSNTQWYDQWEYFFADDEEDDR